MTYTVNYTIDNVFKIDEKIYQGQTFNDLVIKVMVNCDVQFTNPEENFTLPVTEYIPMPTSSEGYIPFESLSRQNIIDWVSESAISKIESVILRRKIRTEIKNQTVGIATVTSGDQFS